MGQKINAADISSNLFTVVFSEQAVESAALKSQRLTNAAGAAQQANDDDDDLPVPAASQSAANPKI